LTLVSPVPLAVLPAVSVTLTAAVMLPSPRLGSTEFARTLAADDAGEPPPLEVKVTVAVDARVDAGQRVLTAAFSALLMKPSPSLITTVVVGAASATVSAVMAVLLVVLPAASVDLRSTSWVRRTR
jgi:hypothetical protein